MPEARRARKRMRRPSARMSSARTRAWGSARAVRKPSNESVSIFMRVRIRFFWAFVKARRLWASEFCTCASAARAAAPGAFARCSRSFRRSAPFALTSSSTLAFPAANTAGSWIGVVVRASSTGQTFTVTDSRGNPYRRAGQFNETVDGTTLGIYYAENIAGGPNAVTVSDTLGVLLKYQDDIARIEGTRAKELLDQVHAELRAAE